MDKQQALDVYNNNRQKADTLLGRLNEGSSKEETELLHEQATGLAEEAAAACKEVFIPLEFGALTSLAVRQKEPVTLEQIQAVMDHPFLLAKIAAEMLTRLARMRADARGDDCETCRQSDDEREDEHVVN